MSFLLLRDLSFHALFTNPMTVADTMNCVSVVEARSIADIEAPLTVEVTDGPGVVSSGN
jgi:hypothetical protein